MNGIFPARLAGRLMAVFSGVVWASTPLIAEEPKPAAGPAPAAPAAESKPSTEAKPAGEAKDFTKGFEMFSKLGMPDVKDATYMQLTGDAMVSYNLGGGGGGQAPTRTGNAWLLSKKEDGRHVFVTGGCRVEEFYPQAEIQKEMEEKMRKAMEGGKKMSRREQMALYRGTEAKKGGEWKEGDLAKDIKAVTEYLGKPENNTDQSRMQMDYGGGWGDLFMFAYHIHRKGHVKEANEILGRLFQMAGDSRKVVQQAMSGLGAAQYGQAYETFGRSHDWKAFADSLEALLARIPPGWDNGPLVRRLADQVKKRLAMKEPPAVAGEGLTPEDQKLAAALTEFPKEGAGSLDECRGFWILKAGVPAVNEETPVGRIVARRIKSFPLLMALLKDDTLTPVSAHSWMGSGYGYRGNDIYTEEEIVQAYENMPKPVTRGEIAKVLLTSVVQSQQDMMGVDGSGMPDDLLKKSRDWYTKNGTKTESEIVRAYLADPDQSKKYVAIAALMASKQEEDKVLLEKAFLESKDPRTDLNFAVQYVAKRGALAKAFVDQFIVKLKTAPPPEGYQHYDETTRKAMDEQMEQNIATMKQFASDENAETILAEILAQTKKWDFKTWTEISPGLAKKLGDEKPSKAITLVLDGALKTKDDFLAGQLLMTASQVKMLKQYGGIYGMMGMEEVEDDGAGGSVTTLPPPAPEETLNVATHAEQWKKLLASERPVDLGSMQTAWEDMTTGQFAAWIMESVYGKGFEQDTQTQQVVGQLGKRAMEIYKARAEARLAGKTEEQLPGFPSPAHVTAEQRTKLKARLSALEGEALFKDVQALSMDEQLAIGEIAGADAAFNAKLSAVVNVVRGVRVDAEDAALRKAAEECKGKPLNRKMVEDLLEHSKRILTAGGGASIFISRTGCVQGAQLKVAKSDQMAELYRGYGNMGRQGGKPQASLVGQVYGQGGAESLNSFSMWTVDVATAAKASDAAKPEAGKPAEPAGKKSAGGKDDLLEAEVDEGSNAMADHFAKQQTDFWEKIDAVCAAKFNAGGVLTITLVGVPPKKP